MKMRYLSMLFFAFFASNMQEVYATNLSPDQAELRLLKNRERTDLLNFLIAKRGYKTYLEIGIADGQNLRSVVAAHKVGVDPSPAAPSDYRLTSDEFFSINQETFDIIFIDGLHICEQVIKDVENSLKCLNPGGIIVMHDCLPDTQAQQSRTPIPGAWNGDVWKAAAYIRMHFADVHFCVLNMDWGCGVLTPHSRQELYPARPIEQLDWNFYITHRYSLLNVVRLEDWLKTIRK